MTVASLLGGFARRAGVVACAALWAFGPSVGANAAPEPAYFSYPFGGEISRIAAGPDGTTYVAGWTTTPDLPASTSTPEPLPDPAYYDVAGFLFVAALAPDGTPKWTSYVRAFASANQSPPTFPRLAVAPDGSAWIAGTCAIETTNPFQAYDPGTRRAYVARFRADGTLAFASPFGGSGDTYPSGIAVAPDGDAVIAGTTLSSDFPGAPSQSNTNNAFVAKVGAYGSGVVWARRFGASDANHHVFSGADVALDPQDGTIVFSCVGPSDSPEPPAAALLGGPTMPSSPYWSPATTFVLRLGPDGSSRQGVRLDFVGANGSFYDDVNAAPVTVAGDGAVLVGGSLAIARLDRELTKIEAVRVRGNSPDLTPSRLIAAADGRLIAMGYVPFEATTRPAIRAFDAQLTAMDRPDVAPLRPRDLAAGSDGALLVAGPWTASAFNVPAGVTPRRGGSFVTKVPLDGSRPPSSANVLVRGPGAADLAWTNDGDAPVRFDLESRQSGADPLDVFVGGTAASDASAGRIADVVPGSDLEFRVVAVFPSGVRAGVAITGTTPVVPPSGITVTEGAGTGIVARWQDTNGSATYYDVQRRVGQGEWMDVRYDRPRYDRPTPPRSEQPDVVPDGIAPIVYRVRAVLRRTRTPWVMSDPFIPASTLRVTQTSGRLRAGGAGGRLDVTGKIVPVAGGDLSFDPATQDLRVLYGDALAPPEFVIAHGDTGWTESGGVWTWSAARTLSGWGHASEIVLDLPHGTFRVVLETGPYGIQQSTRSVAINLAFGAFSGGEVRAWRGTLRRLALR